MKSVFQVVVGNNESQRTFGVLSAPSGPLSALVVASEAAVVASGLFGARSLSGVPKGIVAFDGSTGLLPKELHLVIAGVANQGAYMALGADLGGGVTPRRLSVAAALNALGADAVCTRSEFVCTVEIDAS